MLCLCVVGALSCLMMILHVIWLLAIKILIINSSGPKDDQNLALVSTWIFFFFCKLDCEHYGLKQIYYMVSSVSPRNHHNGGPSEARHRSDPIPQVMCNELHTCPLVTNFFLLLINCFTYVVRYGFWKHHFFFNIHKYFNQF